MISGKSRGTDVRGFFCAAIVLISILCYRALAMKDSPLEAARGKVYDVTNDTWHKEPCYVQVTQQTKVSESRLAASCAASLAYSAGSALWQS